MLQKIKMKLHSQNSVTAKEPVYVDHHERLYDYDLFDQHIRYYAGMDSWKAAPPDAEIDKYVQQRQITPEMHDFLEKMAAGKEQMIFEIEEERALQAEEAEYYANYFDEGVS